MNLTDQHKQLEEQDTSVEVKYKEPTIFSIDLLSIMDKINFIKKLFAPKVIKPIESISKTEEKLLAMDEQIRNRKRDDNG